MMTRSTCWAASTKVARACKSRCKERHIVRKACDIVASRKEKRQAKKEAKERALAMRTFDGNPDLAAMKPREKYVFHSDYFDIDDGYVGCILMYTHNTAAHDSFGPFWGVNRIPSGLPAGVVTMNFEQVKRMSESWIAEHQDKAEGIADTNADEQARGGTNMSRGRAGKSLSDLQVVAQELANGASYLNVHNRMLVKAPDLETLDQAVSRIERLYADRFATLSVSAYAGDQRSELSNLLDFNDKKRGKGEFFTSTEYAGSYSLVTHGIEDANGEYVGFCIGDVNNSAVLFDIDNYRHHVVVASEQIDNDVHRTRIPDKWAAKIGQSALMNGHSVVHLCLDNVDWRQLGPGFASITHKIDMNHGDINMFEMFGDVSDELAIFSAQMQKLILMAEQAYETTEKDRSVIRGSLEDVATKFYVDSGMWRENAAKNRESLRVVGIPHDEVPMLKVFAQYLKTEYNKLLSQSSRDPEKVHAMSTLSTTFNNLLSNNGDLFNTQTTSVIDGVIGGRRTLYDVGGLLLRGKGVAMAQWVTVIDFAVSQMGNGDVVIVHAAENIDVGVRDYVMAQFEKLWKRGGRVVFCYNSVEKCLKDVDFNRYDKADYTLFGNMVETTVDIYQKKLGQDIPADLVHLITSRNDDIMYVRRNFDNVVFHQDLMLEPYDPRAIRR